MVATISYLTPSSLYQQHRNTLLSLGPSHCLPAVSNHFAFPIIHKERGGKTVYPQICLCVPTGPLHLFRHGSKDHLLILYNSNLKTLPKTHSQTLLPQASRLFDQTLTKIPSKTHLREKAKVGQAVAIGLNVIVRCTYWRELKGVDQKRSWTEQWSSHW